jgi:hypothetical protein
MPTKEVIPENITIVQIVNTVPAIYESRIFSNVTTEYVTGLCPGLIKSSIQRHVIFPEDLLKYYPLVYTWVPSDLLFSGYLTKSRPVYTLLISPTRAAYSAHQIHIQITETNHKT